MRGEMPLCNLDYLGYVAERLDLDSDTAVRLKANTATASERDVLNCQVKHIEN
jgi:hypothetical protein